MRMKYRRLLLFRASEVRDVLVLSASDTMITPSSPILFSVLSENEMKQRLRYRLGPGYTEYHLSTFVTVFVYLTSD
jgi:hypothetical protein